LEKRKIAQMGDFSVFSCIYQKLLLILQRELTITSKINMPHMNIPNFIYPEDAAALKIL
jgi:hypothetical protein